MKRDLKLIAEAYKQVSGVKPKLMVPDPDGMWMHTLNKLKYEVYEDGSISVDGDVILTGVSSHATGKTTSIPFKFNRVTGIFMCKSLKEITTLQGAPDYVGGHCAILHIPKLNSLEGSPTYVGGDFMCHFNKQLLSFKGAPKRVEGKFYAGLCPNLKSLAGLTPGCTAYDIDGFTQEQIDQYFESLELKDAATGDPTFDDFFGIGED